MDYISQVPLPVSRLLSFGQWEALRGETGGGTRAKLILLPGSLGTLLAVAAFPPRLKTAGQPLSLWSWWVQSLPGGPGS